MNYDKYKNTKNYPKLLRQAFPEPKKPEYASYAEWGIAMDKWERDCTGYKYKRKELLKDYQDESARMIDLFFYDLLDEFGWDELSANRQSAIKGYIWEDGHSGGFPECYNVACGIGDFIDVLIKE